MRYAQRNYFDGIDANGDMPDWEMQPGMKVVFSHPDSGWPKGFKKGLVVGETYTLKEVRVGRSFTDVELEEVPGKFNSVLFEVVEE